MNRLLILLSTLTLSLGCGGSEGPGQEVVSDQAFVEACESVPGCVETPSEFPTGRETIWRVLVVRDASGRVRIDRAEPVEVMEGTGVPLGRLAGSHLLVGLDRSGNAVDAQLIAFPRVLRAEMADGLTYPVQIELSGRPVDTMGYLRASPEVVRLAVVDRDGREVASMAAPSVVADAGTRSVPFITAGLAGPAPTPAGPSESVPPHCAHVMLLQGEQDFDMARGIAYEKEVELLVPGPTQRAVVRGALGMMTPMLCHGISRIAIGRVDTADAPSSYGVAGIVRQLSTGDMMLINVANPYDFTEEHLAASAEARMRMLHTLIHEAAHCAEALLNAEGSEPGDFKGGWPNMASRAIADETIARARLEKSLIAEWGRMHDSFVDQGWAQAYPIYYDGTDLTGRMEMVREWSSQQVVEGGFMSRYGIKNYAEDLADVVSWAYVGDHYRAAGIPEGRNQTEDYACQEMRRHSEKGLPARFAAIYTKLMFLKDLGMIKGEDAEACTGPNLGLPVERSGFHVWQGTMRLRSYDRGVTAGIGTTEGHHIFQMQAEGEATFDEKTYPATVRLQLGLAPASEPLKKVSWPRGVYELGVLGINRFTLRLDGARSGNFNVHEGYAVVTEASNERIVGSVFMRVAFRPHAPLPVPQTFDPPLAVRFLIEK